MKNSLYQQKQFPVFQNRMYDSYEEAKNCPKGNICLVEDELTGIVSNVDFQSELMVYDRNYQNEQGYSAYFQQHLELVADIVERILGRHKLSEVGCGKGYFLEILTARNIEVLGFDPAYDGNNKLIRREKFSPGLIGSARGLILRHVLEHLPNPVDFLNELAAANGNTGRIYIEVPCFEWIIKRRAWFDIYYEHVNYFRLSDFSRIFGEIVESGHLFRDQYFYVVAELASLRKPMPVKSSLELPVDFLASIKYLSEPTGQPRIVWGGASKGVIFALQMDYHGCPVDAIIDVNPAKQGKYVPATGLRISSPEQVLGLVPIGSPIYIMNSSYAAEIKMLTNNNYKYIIIDGD